MSISFTLAAIVQIMLAASQTDTLHGRRAVCDSLGTVVLAKPLATVARVEAGQVLSLGSCPNGAKVVQQLWRRVQPDSAELTLLFALSIRLQDGRLEQELSRVVKDRTRPDIVRATALAVLNNYIHPGMIVTIQRSRYKDVPWELRGSLTPHSSAIRGTVPLSPALKANLKQLATEIMRTEPGPQKRRDGSIEPGLLHLQANSVLHSLGDQESH